MQEKGKMENLVLDGQDLVAPVKPEGIYAETLWPSMSLDVPDAFWAELDGIILGYGFSIKQCNELTYEGMPLVAYGAEMVFTWEQRESGFSEWTIVDRLKFTMKNTVVQHCQQAVAKNPEKTLVWIWRSRPDFNAGSPQGHDLRFNSVMRFLIQAKEQGGVK